MSAVFVVVPEDKSDLAVSILQLTVVEVHSTIV